MHVASRTAAPRALLWAGTLVLLAGCATPTENVLTKAGGQPLSSEELKSVFAKPVILSWKASNRYTVGTTETTPAGAFRDFDITTSARVGFDHRSLRHAVPARTGTYVIVNNNFCIIYPDRKRPICVRFFKTGQDEYTTLLPDGRHYKTFEVEEP